MKKFSLLSLLFLCLNACQKDIDEIITTIIYEDPPIILVDYDPEIINIVATISGTVTNENGTPMINASVQLNNITSIVSQLTDEDGHFLFKNVNMNAAGTFIEVKQDGFFPGFHRFLPKEGSINYSLITMMTKPNTGSFLADNGGLIIGENGIQIDFLANSVAEANGDVYNGMVEVAARWIDPTSNDILRILPGNLEGLNQNLEEVVLSSYGMMAVALESPEGEPLNLLNGKKAILTIPIPAELINNAPADIPLWYFNEHHGIWVQEGEAILSDGQYIGEVGHFSFWNCDVPNDYIQLSGTIISDTNIPVPNVIVRLTLISTGGWATAVTDNNGFFTGKVPSNSEFALSILQNWQQDCEIELDNIGGFSSDTDLGNIVVNVPGLINISGSFTDCLGDAVSNGWLNISIGNDSYTYYISDEDISELTIYNCNEVENLSIVVVDLDALEQSEELIYPISNSVNLGTITACNNALPEFLSITIDGITTTFLNPDIGTTGGMLPDSSWIGAASPNGSSIYIAIDQFTGLGTYPSDGFIRNYWYKQLPTTSSGAVTLNCVDFATCGFEQMTFTEFGGQGENVTGNFSGRGEFRDSLENLISLPYTAQFRIIRDE